MTMIHVVHLVPTELNWAQAASKVAHGKKNWTNETNARAVNAETASSFNKSTADAQMPYINEQLRPT